MSKICFKCARRKRITEFYKHPMMADGHLNKCKECTKSDVRLNNRKTRRERREYERERYQQPERKAYGKAACELYRKIHPGLAKARSAVGCAIKSGRLVRGPCEVCGLAKSQAHHDDYRKPLDVRWLCFRHHREVHGQLIVE